MEAGEHPNGSLMREHSRRLDGHSRQLDSVRSDVTELKVFRGRTEEQMENIEGDVRWIKRGVFGLLTVFVTVGAPILYEIARGP